MDSLEVVFSIVNHPLKIAILKFLEENEEVKISFNELLDYFSTDKLFLITSIWELYNDHLLIKKNSSKGTLFELTESARELNKIMKEFEYWSQTHQFYGGI